MMNYKRYTSLTEGKYNKKGLSYLLMRKKLDEIIVPYLQKIENENILEAGVGYGYYKDVYFSNNNVTGFDVNPELGKNLGIEIISGKADEIGKIDKKYDRVLSFFMTEYLKPTELRKFIHDGVDIVSDNGNGIFATTIIVKKGLGWIYTKMAAVRGIKKYSYSYREIKQMVNGMIYNLIPLNTYFGIPMAVLLEIKK